MAYKSKIDQAAASKRHYEKNKQKIKERTFLRNEKQRDKNKRYVNEIKSKSECIDCGENNPLVLDFDHVKGDKVMAVSDMIGSAYSLAAIQKEIEKCEVRCSNCHRVVTHERRKINQQQKKECKNQSQLSLNLSQKK
jgi:orotate phosphoribosyltransferase